METGVKARANDVFVRPFAMLGKFPFSLSVELEGSSLISTRPSSFIAQEPMLAAITAFMSMVYGILYLSFIAFPIIYGKGGHGFKAGPSGLMVRAFLPLFAFGRREADPLPSPVPAALHWKPTRLASLHLLLQPEVHQAGCSLSTWLRAPRTCSSSFVLIARRVLNPDATSSSLR